MLHDPKTVIGSDFDQETAEKIAPQFIPRLELANCIYEKVANSSGPLSSWPALTQAFNLIAYFALVQKKSKQNSEM